MVATKIWLAGLIGAGVFVGTTGCSAEPEVSISVDETDETDETTEDSVTDPTRRPRLAPPNDPVIEDGMLDLGSMQAQPLVIRFTQPPGQDDPVLELVPGTPTQGVVNSSRSGTQPLWTYFFSFGDPRPTSFPEAMAGSAPIFVLDLTYGVAKSGAANLEAALAESDAAAAAEISWTESDWVFTARVRGDAAGVPSVAEVLASIEITSGE